MKLSMWILADWLKSYEPILEVKSGKQEIENARLFSSEIPIEKNTLYIGRTHDFFDENKQCILCSNNNDMMILHSNDIEQIFNEILNAFDYYSKWYISLDKATDSGCLLTTLLDLSYSILPNPLFVLDSAQVVLAISSNYPLGTVDEVWDELLTTGSSDINRIIEYNTSYANTQKYHQPYKISTDIFPRTAYNINLFVQDTWAGVFNMLELDTPVSKGTLDLFNTLGYLIEQWITLHADQNDIHITDSLLTDILNGQSGLIPDLERYLNLLSWKQNDLKLVIKCKSISETININMYLCKALNVAIKSIYAFVYYDSIVLICNLKLVPQDQLFSQLIPWLKRSKYHCGYSNPFKELDLIYTQYHQADVALSAGEKLAGAVHGCNDCVIQYTFETIRNCLKADICHPVINQLKEYDQDHHSDYFNTLYLYIKNERNQLITSNVLNIHRNSLIYRIKRLEELIDVNLDDPDIRFHILLSYEYLTFITKS